ncbi:MAG: hypothetical protein R2708_24990 [Vicinamibacterales bacterium]
MQAYSWGRAFSRVDVRVGRATGAVEATAIFAPQDVRQWQDATGACARGPSPAARPARYEALTWCRWRR